MRQRALWAMFMAPALTLAACGSDTTTAGDGASGGTASSAPGGAATEACGGLLGTFKPLEGVTFTPTKDGTFTVVTSLPGPGFWDGGDTVDKVDGGVEYCMAKAIGELLGQKGFEARNEAFDAITTGVAEDYDLALTQSSITDERKKAVDFTESYYKSDQSIIVATGTKVATLDDVKGLVLGAQVGTTGEYFAGELIKPTGAVQSFDSLDGAYTALVAGQIDAVIMDTAINLGEVSRSGGKLEVVAQFANEDFYGGILPKGSTNVAAINAAIDEIKSNGALNAFIAQYLGGDPTAVPFIKIS